MAGADGLSERSTRLDPYATTAGATYESMVNMFSSTETTTPQLDHAARVVEATRPRMIPGICRQESVQSSLGHVRGYWLT